MGKTLLFVHSENSVKECALKINDILQRAKDLGYKKVILTDTGNMTGAIEFYNKAKDFGILPVIGVECFLEELDGLSRITLIAKDRDGYLALCRLVTSANANITDGRPLLTVSMLKDAAVGCNKSVVACCGGLLGYVSYPYIRNKRYMAEAGKQTLSVQTGDQDKKQKLEMRLGEIKEQLEAKRKCRKTLQKDVKAAQAAKVMGASVDSSGKEAELKSVTSEIDRFTRMKKSVEKELQVFIREEALVKREMAKREAAMRMVKPEKELQQEITDRCVWLKELFGDDFFIEYTCHGENGEVEVVQSLRRASGLLGIRAILSNTPYTLDGSEDEVLKWHLVSSLMNNEWIPITPTSGNYGILTEEELRGRFAGILPEEEIQRAIEATDEAFAFCGFTLDTSEHYPKYPVPDGMTATDLMVQRARENIKNLYPGEEWDQEHEDKFQYEVSVINKTGYSDYTLTIADILNDARKMADPRVESCLIGPGRGSGAGSIVNYLMGITSIDPMRYGLIFERYLNIERVSPPDIDSDIATSIREVLVDKIKQKYNKKEGCVGVCSILTKSKLTGKAAIKAAARILSHRYYRNTTALYSLSDKMSKSLPPENKLKLSDHEAELLEAFPSKEAKEILRCALLMEGVVWAYGTHAAGVIISDSGDITDYAPLINLGTKENPVWNIQYDMVESESIGLLKMDMLGLKTMDTCYESLLMIFAHFGRKIDLYHIPFEKEVFHEIYCKGMTNGVFQCESAGMKRLWMDLKPDNIEDIIAGIALYRPGPMDFIPNYIQGKENPSKVVYKTEKLRPILQNTYGCIIYQEQVMKIVRELAGYSMGRSDLVRRAMSKKKDTIMQKERQNFVYGNETEGIKGCVNNGIPAEIADSIYDDMVDFAKYAFNKSHAAAYALVSYQTAWLKYHYPEEFMASAMDAAAEINASGKLPPLLHECARMGIKVNRPDINRSIQGFSVIEGELYYGLGTIKGVKENAGKIVNERGAGFSGVKDFMMRVKINRTALKNLVKAGAFSSLHKSRSGLLSCLDELLKLRDDILFLQERTDSLSIELARADLLESDQKRKEAQFNLYRGKLYTKKKEWEELEISNAEDPVAEKLQFEKETLFAYITAHPMDAYDEKKGCVCLGDFELEDVGTKGVLVMGCITDMKIVKSKKDGNKMAIFTLQDKTGEQKCICFPSKYGQCEEHLKEGCVVSMYCNVSTEKDDKESLLLVVNKTEMMEPDLCPIVFSVKNGEQEEVKEKVSAYIVEQGHPLLIHVRDGAHAGQLVKTGWYVHHTITEAFPKEEVLIATTAKRRKKYGA